MLSDSSVTAPYVIDFPSIGSTSSGFITVAEYEKSVPFAIKRVYWTYYTPHHIERGGHAHYELSQILIAVCGIIDITVESRQGVKQTFTLDSPDKGLVLPPPFWHTMRFSHNAVLLSLASDVYIEADYIRDYQTFKNI